MDAMEFNKIAAAVLAPALGLLMINWAGELIYEPAHSYDHDDQAYVIDLPDAEEEVMVADAGPSIHELLASADPAGGEALWRQCSACHKLVEGENGVGPYLYNVVGREIAAVDAFSYSSILNEYGAEGRVWDAENLNAFLEAPRSWAPGTNMGYNGMRRDTDRADMIAYLITSSGGEVSDFIEAAAPAVEPEVDAAEATVEETVTEMAEEATTAAEETVAAVDEAINDAATDVAETAEAVDSATEEAVAGATEAVEGAVADATEAAEDAVAEATDAAEGAVEGATEMAGAAEEAAGETIASAEQAVEDTTAAVEEGAAAVLPAFMQNASAEAGERVFRQCRACHVLEDGVNRVGPHLYDIVGREIGGVEGFRYSNTLAEMDGAWTYENLDAFLEAPRQWAPGTKMSYAGLRKPEDRANIIAYLEAASE
ncbi:MAG: c-type cytochrome [Pseudomonadota bacterium]